MAKVIVVTTSMGTKWEAYSQTMLKLKVPEWQRLIVDGRRNWSPTGFIESVIHKDVDYVFHVDEDCFVQSREALRAIVKSLDRDKSFVAAGIPDGGYYYREHNPAALNLFFVAFRTDFLRMAWEDRANWPELSFRHEFADEVMRQCPNLDNTRINWDEGEPYYPLFWSLLSHGGRFLYLREELYKPRWSSRVFSSVGDAVAEHMWYLRTWFSVETMPGHDCPNRVRFDRFQREWHSIYGVHLRAYLILLFMHIKRLARRLTNR